MLLCHVQKDLQNLEDAETELLMLDEEDKIPYPVKVYNNSILILFNF